MEVRHAGSIFLTTICKTPYALAPIQEEREDEMYETGAPEQTALDTVASTSIVV